MEYILNEKHSQKDPIILPKRIHHFKDHYLKHLHFDLTDLTHSNHSILSTITVSFLKKAIIIINII